PVLQAQVSGASDTPAYRGTAYIVVDSEDLTARRGSIPQYRFEVTSTGETVDLETVESNATFATQGGWNGASGWDRTSYLDGLGGGPGDVWLFYFGLVSSGGSSGTRRCFISLDGN